MLKIKLSPVGKKNDRHYRIIVVEGKSKLTGRTVDSIGHYHPLLTADKLTVDSQKLATWISKGATPTETLRRLLRAH